MTQNIVYVCEPDLAQLYSDVRNIQSELAAQFHPQSFFQTNLEISQQEQLTSFLNDYSSYPYVYF